MGGNPVNGNAAADDADDVIVGNPAAAAALNGSAAARDRCEKKSSWKTLPVLPTPPGALEPGPPRPVEWFMKESMAVLWI